MWRHALLISVFLSQLATPAGTIRGTVVDAITDEPVADAVVVLNRNSTRVQTVVAARDGTFLLNNLDSGSYTLGAGRSGYVTASFGERNFQNSAKPIVVKPGVSTESIVMRLKPTGTVSGRIRDSGLQPMIGLPVRIFRYVYRPEGRRELELAGETTTNDRGEYRLFGIKPGRHILTAGGPASYLRRAEDINPNDVAAESEMAFYPSTNNLDLAESLDIVSGLERRGMDFVLASPQLFNIRGHVNVQGAERLSVYLSSFSLQPEEVLHGELGAVRIDRSSGEFEVSGLRPGNYLLTASIDDKASAQMTVRLGERDLDGVELKLADQAELHATVLLDGEVWHPNPREAPSLEIDDPEHGQKTRVRVDPDGSVTISNVHPASYRPFLLYLPPGRYLKSATIGDVDVMVEPLKLSGKTSETLKLDVSSKAASLKGVVRDSHGRVAPRAAVVLVPNQRNRRELYSMTVTSENGEFEIPSIAPGDYKVFAWESIEQYSWLDPSVIAPFDEKGRAIHFEELEKEKIEVPVIPSEIHP